MADYSDNSPLNLHADPSNTVLAHAIEFHLLQSKQQLKLLTCFLETPSIAEDKQSRLLPVAKGLTP